MFATSVVVVALAFAAWGTSLVGANFKPEVTGVSPNAGLAAGGNTVKINGEDLDSVSGVEFGTVEATSFTAQSPSSILAVAPPHTAEKVNVRVRTSEGWTPELDCKKVHGVEHQCVLAGPYKFDTPTVTAVTPETGPLAGGTPVTLTGTGFAVGSTETVINVGKGAATSVNCTSTTTCTGVTPASTSSKPNTAYLQAIIHTESTAKTKKNRAVGFHYE